MIRLTLKSSDQPVWINPRKIELYMRGDGEKGSIISFGEYNYVTEDDHLEVHESPEQVTTMCLNYEHMLRGIIR